MPTSYHYDPLPPPPPFPTADPAGHPSHSPAHWSPAVSDHAPHPALGSVTHSMTSYYSHPAFLPHAAARDLREAQAGMQVCYG